jgi:S-adenosylmethionine decarboxylase
MPNPAQLHHIGKLTNQLRPGLHIIADFSSNERVLLSDYEATKQLFDQQISDFGLTKIGEVYHNFPQGGFTGVVCLAESHISIHTWPEFGRVTFDVFLSNYLKQNDNITRHIYLSILSMFKASQVTVNELSR